MTLLLFTFYAEVLPIRNTCIILNAGLVVDVAAHERDHRRTRRKLAIATITILLIDLQRPSLQLFDLRSLFFYQVQVVLDYLGILHYGFVFELQFLRNILLDDFEFELWLLLQNFKDDYWIYDLFFLLTFCADAIQCSLDERFADVVFELCEVGQRLHPQLANFDGVRVRRLRVLDAALQDMLSLALMNVIVKQLLPQPKRFAAFFDTFGYLIYLEQEEDVV